MALRLAIGLLSGAAIAYQLLLMRLFSIAQWHHFAYMVISLALLGYGASGALLTILRRPLLKRFPTVFGALVAGFGLFSVACFVLTQRLGLNPLEIMWDPRQLVVLSATYLILAIPFLCAGGAVALALARFGPTLHQIYRADLIGAACGAVAAIGALYVFEPTTCLLLVGCTGWAAAAVASLEHKSSPRSVALFAAVPLAFLLWPSSWLEPHISEYKDLRKALAVPGAEVVARRSSPLASLAAVRSTRIPFRVAPGLSFAYTGEIPEQIALFSDGEIAGILDPVDASREYLEYLPEALVFRLSAFDREPRVALLGAGAGPALALALGHGAGEVHVVELNPQSLEILTHDLATLGGRLYKTPSVHLRTVSPRAFLASERSRFDLIYLSISGGAGGEAARGLRESNDLTVEAFELLLNRLTDTGIFSVSGELTAPPRVSLKLLATAAEALERQGFEPRERVAVIRSWNRYLVLVKRSPFLLAEIDTVRSFSSALSFDLGYYPGMSESEANRFNLLERPELFRGAKALLAPDRSRFFDRYKFQIEPATDDRPYFFQFFRWGTLAELMNLRTLGGAALVDWSFVLVLVTLIQAAGAGFVMILVPLWFVRSGRRGAGSVGLYFFCLGLGFLFLEIAFIQRFTLFFTHPLQAVALVLAGFLFFAGLGSELSDRIRRSWPRLTIPRIVGWIVFVALLHLVLLPPLFERWIGSPTWLKVPFALLAIAPLALPLGMPFPLGLKRVTATRPNLVPWAWGVNGWASVVSAVLATLMAIQLGFTAVVVSACGLYLLAAIVAPARQS